MIRNIARNELRYLFYSPLAWFVLIVFFTQCAYIFAEALIPKSLSTDMLLTLQKERTPLLFEATTALFKGTNGVLGQAISTLFLIIPLLAMGIINREVNNGSIQLLYSSPVKPFQIVIGKFLGMLTFNSLLILVLLLFGSSGFFLIENFDYGIVYSGIFGLFLLLCACSSIGIFMSSITNYPIVAAFGTFLILMGLAAIGSTLQQYDFLRDITWSLALRDRLSKLMQGLVRTKDIFVYLNITAIFLILTIFQLQQFRNRRSHLVNVGRSAFIVLTFIFIQYIVSRPQFVKHWDTAPQELNTIPEDIQQIIAQMNDAPLVVTLYVNLLDHISIVEKALPASRNEYLEEVWDRYLRFKPDIQFKYEYFYDNAGENKASLGNGRSFSDFPGKNIHEVAKELAKLYKLDFTMFKSPEEMRKKIDLYQEGYNTVMHLSYKGRTEFLRSHLRHSDDVLIGTALKRLITNDPPFVGFVTGNLERSVYQLGKREYGDITGNKSNAASIMNLGFPLDTINLATQDIGDTVSALVVADPRRALTEDALTKIRNYVQEGRNMVVFAEPDKAAYVNPILKEMGVELMPGMLLQPRRVESAQFVQAKMQEGYLDMMHAFFTPTLMKIITAHYAPLQLKTAGGLKVIDSVFDAMTILKNVQGKSWLDQGRFVSDSITPVFNASEGDQYGDFPMGLMLTREINGKQQRIAVFSDADMVSNGEKNNSMDIYKGIYSWLHYKEFPVHRREYDPVDLLTIKPKAAKLLKPFLVIVVPALILLLGYVVLSRRARK